MIARGLTPPWGAQVRTETVDDPELLAMMRDSNCFNVYVGFESINPRTLKLFQKKQDLAKIERSIERFHANKIRIHGMFVVGSDEDDVETIDATAEFALKHDIDSVQFMILTPIPGSPDWDTLYAKGDKYVINRNWTFYDGHHAVHQPRRMSPWELQTAAIGAMEKFYSWRGIAKKLLKRDFYYATIRYWGKKMLREWWKDEENRAYVGWLRDQLYAEAREHRPRLGEDGRGAGRAPAGQGGTAAPALPRRARRDGGAAGRGRGGRGGLARASDDGLPDHARSSSGPSRDARSSTPTWPR